METFTRILIHLFIFTTSLYGINAVSKIKFVDDLCFLTKGVTIDLRYENAGILMSVPRHTRKDSLYCRMRLLAHKGSSVVLSIYRYDIPSQDQLTIQDSDKHTVALIGSALFNDEKKSIISAGEMVVTYTRNNSSATSGFQFTFTQVHESPCMDNEFACKNGKCIEKDLACNGHNHCGDNSDNLKCVPENLNDYNPTPSTKSTNYSIVWLILFITVSVVLFILTIILIAVVINKSPKLKSSINTATACGQDSPTDPVPLQSVSSTVSANHTQSSTVEDNHPQPSESLFNRVRHSFRRNGTPREEVAPTHQRFEVPSMYPNLDQLPTAPETGGTDNPGYKSEE